MMPKDQQSEEGETRSSDNTSGDANSGVPKRIL